MRIIVNPYSLDISPYMMIYSALETFSSSSFIHFIWHFLLFCFLNSVDVSCALQLCILRTDIYYFQFYWTREKKMYNAIHCSIMKWQVNLKTVLLSHTHNTTQHNKHNNEIQEMLCWITIFDAYPHEWFRYDVELNDVLLQFFWNAYVRTCRNICWDKTMYYYNFYKFQNVYKANIFYCRFDVTPLYLFVLLIIINEKKRTKMSMNVCVWSIFFWIGGSWGRLTFFGCFCCNFILFFTFVTHISSQNESDRNVIHVKWMNNGSSICVGWISLMCFN